MAKDSILKHILSKTDPLSAMRYVMVFCTLFIIFTVVGVWAIISLRKNEICDIPWGLAVFVSSLVAILITGKVAQAIWGEKPTNASQIKELVDIAKEANEDDNNK